MVTDFVVEPMHTIDGGVLMNLAECLWTAIKETTADRVGKLNSYTQWLADVYAPLDITRKMSSLEMYKKWKMRQARNFFMYLAYPAWKQFGAPYLKDGNSLLLQIKRILHGLRLVAGFSAFPIQPSKLEKAQSLFKSYANVMAGRIQYWSSYKNHNLLHVLEDCHNKGCHLDRNSAYKYESFHQLYKKLFQRGPMTHIQIL